MFSRHCCKCKTPFSLVQLRQIAESQVLPAQVARHLELLEKQQQRQLTPTERSELAELRTQADHLMVRKAYAWALLRWHGVPLPTLKNPPSSNYGDFV